MSPNGAPNPAPEGRRSRLNPMVLGYLIGPAALVALLIVRHFGVIAREPVWLWVAVFGSGQFQIG